jgi:hypothetical protein
MSLIGNPDLVVGAWAWAWAGIRDTRLGKLGRAERVCAASLLLPGCHANGREEMKILVFGRKQQGLQNYLRFTQTPLLFPRQPSKSIRDWPSDPGTDALPPLILFLKKIRSRFLA